MNIENHMINVSNLCIKIGQKMLINEERMRVLAVSAYLHDIGKYKIPGRILDKPGKLNSEELLIMRKHPIIGAEILKNNGFMDDITRSVLYHHERYDGKGYPVGLKALEIPLNSRIIALADSFDVMISNRAYKRAMSLEKALNEVLINSGKQFDPTIVEFFKSVYKEIVASEEYIFKNVIML